MEQLKLNMIPNGVNPVFHASQYDKGRQIRFVLDETLSGAEVTVSYRAKDGTEYGNVQMSVSGNTITDTIPEEVLTDYGIIEGEVNIDGIGSLNFFVEVEKDAYDGGVITTQTATGAIATFETNIETAFVSLKSDINPVQDLHGYTKPWSGGAGKNKLDYLSNLRTSSSGLTISATNGGAIHYQGTATVNYCQLTYIFNLSIPSGTTITVSRDVSVGHQHYFDFTFTDDTVEYVRIMPNTTSTTYTLPKDLKSIDIVCLGLAAGTAYNETVKFQLEVGSQATSWEPYSNICPISGFSALNVTRTGVNLAKYWKNAYINANGTIITNNNNALCELGYLKSGVKIAFNHYQNTYGCGIAVYSDSSYTNKIDVNGNIQSNVSTLTLEHSGYYLFWFNVATNTASETFVNENSLGVYVGETVGTFEPYNGQTATVNFGQTVYGGVADVTGGKVTVNKAYKDLGTLNYTMYTVAQGNLFRSDEFNIKRITQSTEVPDIISSIFVAAANASRANYTISMVNGSARIDIIDNDYSDAEAFKSAMSGVQIVYPLATPIEITTTPENLTAISGENNVYGDTNGDTEVEYYIEV